MADQIVASVSNLLVLILVARSVAPTEFGAFSIAMETYLVFMFVSRGISSDVLATAHSADSVEGLRRAACAGAAVTIGVSVGLALVIVVVGVGLGGVLGATLAVLGLVLPGLLVQDFVRYVFIVRGRPSSAFLIDALWFILEIPALLLATRAEQSSPVLLAVWGGCGVVAGVVGIAWARLVPTRPSDAIAWLARHARLWPYFVLENLLFRATILIVMVALAGTAGLAAVAGLRAATAIFAPVGVLGRGVVMVAVPDLARRVAEPGAVRAGVRRLAWVLTPLPLVLAVVLTVAPDRLGASLFGETWALAAPLLMLTAISAAASMYASAVAVGLRAQQAARAGLSARIAVALLALVAALGGGLAGGAYGAALGLAVSSPFQAAIWWWQLRAAGPPSGIGAASRQDNPNQWEENT